MILLEMHIQNTNDLISQWAISILRLEGNNPVVLSTLYESINKSVLVERYKLLSERSTAYSCTLLLDKSCFENVVNKYTCENIKIQL